MPIYEYQCQACGKHFEEMQKVSDEPLKVCPNCGKPDLKKMMSHTSFQLKGGGYYATDYKKPAQPTEKEGEKPKENTQKDAKKDPAKETNPSKTSEKKPE